MGILIDASFLSSTFVGDELLSVDIKFVNSAVICVRAFLFIR
jgi:hypothetical protein